MTLDELGPHLHTLPDHPDWIPYRTTYYARTWGFCLTHAQLEALGPGPFEVVIDSSIRPGELSYGELVIPGELHRRGDHQRARLPPVTGQRQPVRHRRRDGAGEDAAGARRRRYTYRFLFAPGTIGSITWLSQNPEVWPRIRHGLVLTGLGGGGRLVYKQTRHGSRPSTAPPAMWSRRGDGEIRGLLPVRL